MPTRETIQTAGDYDLGEVAILGSSGEVVNIAINQDMFTVWLSLPTSTDSLSKKQYRQLFGPPGQLWCKRRDAPLHEAGHILSIATIFIIIDSAACF